VGIIARTPLVKLRPMSKSTCLFVYGTLLSPKEWSDPVDSHNFEKVAPFLQEIMPAFLEGAVLYDFGSFPGAYPGKGEIAGEVQVIDPLAFEVLDPLEGHPGLYYREKVIARLQDAGPVEAWIYWAPETLRFSGEKIEHGDWLRRKS